MAKNPSFLVLLLTIRLRKLNKVIDELQTKEVDDAKKLVPIQ